MYRPALAALVVLLMVAPVAGALHPLLPKSPSERIASGSSLSIAVFHTYHVTASYAGKHEVRGQGSTSIETQRMQWEGQLLSSGSVQFDGFYNGKSFAAGNVLRNGSFAYESVSTEYVSGSSGVTTDLTTVGACQRVIGKGPGQLMGEAMPFSAQAHLVPGGGAARVTLRMAPLGWGPWEGCESRTTGQQYKRSVNERVDISPAFASFIANALHNKPPNADDVDYGAFTFDLPLGSDFVSFSRTQRYALPGSDTNEYTVFCPMPTSDHYGEGECVATSTLRVRAYVDRCGIHLDSYKVHLKAVKQIPPPQKGAPEAGVIAWGEEATKDIEALLMDTRAYLLVCGEDLPGGEMEAISRIAEMYRDALLQIARERGLTERGANELLGAERQVQLLGGREEGTEFWGDVKNAIGRFYVEVHSPVSIHAWTQDGRHVGWDAAKGAADVEIEGAEYEGAPGGYQRISLPSGFYKIAVDELAEGTYLLNVSWSGEGAEGYEEHFVHAQPGRTTSTHFAFDRSDDDGALMLDTFPLQRGATPATFRFAEPLSSRGDAGGVAPPTSSTRAPRGADGAGEAPGGDADAGGANAATPAGGLFVIAVAVMVALALRRRP